MPLDSFRVTFLPHHPPRIIPLVGNASAAAVWSLHDLDIATDYAGALAYQGEPRTLEIHSLVTAEELLALGLVDGIVPEPDGGAHTDPDQAAEFVKETVRSAWAELAPLSAQQLIEDRYGKFRRMGNFFAEAQPI